jgi:hypothetical protein
VPQSGIENLFYLLPFFVSHLAKVQSSRFKVQSHFELQSKPTNFKPSWNF